MNWEKYKGKTVSALIMGKDNKEENYIGIVEDIIDDYMILDTRIPNLVIDKIIFRINLIKSIWIYKPEPSKKRKTALRDKIQSRIPRKD